MQKKMVVILLITVMILTTTACKETSSEDELIGTWTLDFIETPTGEMKAEDIDIIGHSTLVFTKDSVILTFVDQTFEYKWTLTKPDLISVYIDDIENSIEYIYEDEKISLLDGENTSVFTKKSNLTN